MSKAYQSIYVSLYRWNFKNFGQGSLPQFKSLFNASFLLVVVLTNVLLYTKLMIKAQWITLNAYSCLAIVGGAVLFLMLNHLLLLNNKWFRGINAKLDAMKRRNLNLWTLVLLANVFIACGLFFIY